MENNDPWGLMRGRDKFLLWEAAHIVSNVPTFRQHVFALGVETSTKDDRDDCARVLEAEWELKGAADALCEWIWHGRDDDAPPPWTLSTFGCQVVTDGKGKVTRYGPIQRAALEAWCSARGMRPAFFQTEAREADKPLATLERETLLSLIAVLAEAAGIDLRAETKGHAEAKRIRTWADRRKVTLSAETIAKKLVAAREQIYPIGPEQFE